MPGQFVRVDSNFPNHHKTLRIERILGVGKGGHVIYLWLWASLYRPDGDLRGMTDDDVEAASRWSGTAGAFVIAAQQVGFIDGDVDARRIHDWTERNEYFAQVERRQQDALRAARHRSGVTSHGGTVTASRSICDKSRSRTEKSRLEEKRREEKRDPPPTPSAAAHGSDTTRSPSVSARRGGGDPGPPRSRPTVGPPNGDPHRPDLRPGHLGDLARAWPWVPGDDFPPLVFFDIIARVGKDAKLTEPQTLAEWNAYLDDGHRQPGKFREWLAARHPPAVSPANPIERAPGEAPPLPLPETPALEVYAAGVEVLRAQLPPADEAAAFAEPPKEIAT